MMQEFEILDTPFRQKLHMVPTNLMKRKIIRTWQDRQEQIRMITLRFQQPHLYSQQTVDEFFESIRSLYQEIQPLLIRGIREDYPDDPITITLLSLWICNCVLAFNLCGYIKERNIWLDLYAFFEKLEEYELLPVDQYGSLVLVFG